MRKRADELPSSRTALGLAALIAAAAGLVALFALGGEVRASGELLAGRPAVDRVELLGTITLYVDQRITAQGLGVGLEGQDLLTALGFGALSAVAFMAAALREIVAGTNNRWWRFYFLAGAGAAFLCADELYTLHETFGYNANWVTALPGISHADDFFILVFGFAGAAFCVWYRRILLEHRQASLIMVLGGAIFAAAALFDWAGLPREEELETLGALTLCASFALIVLEQFARGRFAGATNEIAAIGR